MRLPLSFLLVLLCSMLPSCMRAQSLSLNDATTVQPVTKRIGLNFGGVNFYDSGQMMKNLIGSINPGFEPLTTRQIWTLDTAGTTTSFTLPDIYYGAPQNYFTGGTFTIVESQSGGAELGCTGTIATNTTNYPNEPTFTTSAACPAAFAVGDQVVLNIVTFPTPEAWLENSQGGIWSNIQNGGKLTADTTDLCATCGKQALTIDATASGSTAGGNFFFDSAPGQDLFVLMNGTYQLSFWAKTAAQSPQITLNAARYGSAGFNCGAYTQTPSNTWTQYTFTCSATEQAGITQPGTAYVSVSVTGGAVYFDNVSFTKMNTSANNPTALRDEAVATLKNFYGQASGGNPGLLRYWVSQNAQTLDSWTQPTASLGPTSPGNGYMIGPSGAGSTGISLEDYLVLCQTIGAEPYLEVPVTITPADASALVDFLAGSTSTAYGARRAALGQTAPWTSLFSQIHLSFCNECWNGQSFSGQALPFRPNTPNSEFYYDYSVRARDIFAALRSSPSYSPTAFDLVLNAQTGVSYSMDAAIKRAKPDSIEIGDYQYGNVSDFSTDAILWTGAMVEPYDNVVDPSDPSNFYQSVHDYQAQNTCGPNGNAACKVNIYEWGQGTQSGSVDQQHLDYINAGAGQGVISALQPLLNMQYDGIVNQSYFAFVGNNNMGPNGETAKLWGTVVDMGGSTNNVRPQFLALSLVNQSIIGPMYSCPINSNATFSFAGESNNGAAIPPGSPALTNVPLLYSFCFQNGTSRSIVLINTDLTASHSIAFSGSNPPAGTVTVRQYAPPSLDSMNEAPTGTSTFNTAATVFNTSSTVTDPASLTLPPYSVTALDYNVPLPGPTFSPAPQVYGSTQSVTLADSTPGATIYYTTDGSKPTTSSPVYNTPLSVASSETLSAIAVTSTLTSSVSTAAYTITPPPPAPTFSIPAGSYHNGQTVSIADANSSAAIFYTTDGSAPTASSTPYTGPITLSTSTPGGSETISAIAIANTLSSTVATANYTVVLATANIVFHAPTSVGYNGGVDLQLTSSDSPSGNVTYSINGKVFQVVGWYNGVSNVYEGNAVPADGWVNGNNTLTAAFAGDSTYAPQTFTQSCTYSGAPLTAQTITFPAPAAIAYPASTTETMQATASSGLPITYSVTSGPGTISGSTLTVTGTGTVTVVANQAGNASYSAASAVTQNVTVNSSRQTAAITFHAPSSVVYGNGVSLQLTTPANPSPTGNVTYTINGKVFASATFYQGLSNVYEGSATPADGWANGNDTVTAAFAGDSVYAPQTLTVIIPYSGAETAQTITFPQPATVTYPATKSITLKATASSGLAVTYIVSSGPATVSGSKLTITGTGTIVVVANQAGNGTYNYAPSVSVNILSSSSQAAALTFTTPTKVNNGQGVNFQMGSTSNPVPTGNVTFAINGQVFQTIGWYQGYSNTYENTAVPADGWVNGTNTITAAFAGDAIYAPKTITVKVTYSGAP